MINFHAKHLSWDATPHNIHINTTPIASTNTHRRLGVILDANLTFYDHMTSVINNFRRRVVLLSYMSQHLTSNAIIRLYKGYVRPVAKYACMLWQFKMSRQQSQSLE